MKTPHTDTHPNAERLHMEMIRKAPLSRRLQMVASLVKTTYQLSWMGLCERYPNETGEVRMERFIFYLYGDKSLAERVMSHLSLRKTEVRLSENENT